jgi:hypothetical protein
MTDLSKFNLSKASRRTSVLGLSLHSGRLDGVVLRRDNGEFHTLQSFSVALTLDPLTNDPQLVGREIRNHLDAAGVREKSCVIGLPLKWALTSHVAVPELPEADVASFLEIEAERGFPCDVNTLYVATARCRGITGKQHALLVGIPRTHVGRLEQVLVAAKLKPLSFSLAIAALQPPDNNPAIGTMALLIGESQVALQITAGSGVAALRALEGALENEGSQRVLHADVVAREARITIGQLPPDLTETVRNIRIFGPPDVAQQLADEMELRLDVMGLKVEPVTSYAVGAFGVRVPDATAVRPAFSLAAEYLIRRMPGFEFLPPRVPAWKQFAGKYSSGKLRGALTVAGAVALIVAGIFFFQQCQLWRLQSQWIAISSKVGNLEVISKQISQYRPWYDENVRGLTILRGLTQAFPEDGSVTAKTVEIRDLNVVTCTGTARNYQLLLETLKKLRDTPQIHDANLGPTRGQTPALQFSFSFVWGEGGKSAN